MTGVQTCALPISLRHGYEPGRGDIRFATPADSRWPCVLKLLARTEKKGKYNTLNGWGVKSIASSLSEAYVIPFSATKHVFTFEKSHCQRGRTLRHGYEPGRGDIRCATPADSRRPCGLKLLARTEKKGKYNTLNGWGVKGIASSSSEAYVIPFSATKHVLTT